MSFFILNCVDFKSMTCNDQLHRAVLVFYTNGVFWLMKYSLFICN